MNFQRAFMSLSVAGIMLGGLPKPVLPLGIFFPVGQVLGLSTQAAYPYPSGSLVNDNSTIYFISATEKVPFTNYKAFTGLGYSLANVVKGDLSNYSLPTSYKITTADNTHPWGQWLIYNKTIYYSAEQGLIGTPNPAIFFANGGQWNYVVKANNYDVAVLQAAPNLPLLAANDSRVIQQSTAQAAASQNIPTPTPTPVIQPQNPTPTSTPTQTPGQNPSPTPTPAPSSTPIQNPIPTPTPTPTPAPTPTTTPAATQRSFHMGITFWPPSTDTTEILNNIAFVQSNEDLNVYQQLGGVPWVEASQNAALPQAVTSDWSGFKAQFNSARPTYIALTPLDVNRDGMALYANNSGDENPLPAPWSGYQLNNPAVEQAYLNYVIDAVNFFQPKYLAIDIETNQYYESQPASWQNMVSLHQYIYQQVKAAYPNITILPTIQYDHLEANTVPGEAGAISQLAQYSDAIGLSTYPYSTPSYSVPDNYFNDALQFNKPVAISETGFPSQTFTWSGETFNYSQNDQAKYYSVLLNFANTNHSPFVVTFTGTDYDKLIPSLPASSQAGASAYEYDGLRDSSNNLKSSYSVWQQYLNLTYSGQ